MTIRKCKAYNQLGGGERDRCGRFVPQEPPFCWQHRDAAHIAANALNTHGAVLQAAMIQHLTVVSKPCS